MALRDNVSGRLSRLRGRRSDDADAARDIDDGADDEEIDAAPVDDPELAALDDDDDAGGVSPEDDRPFLDILREIEATPPLPLTAPFTTSLQSLLSAWAAAPGGADLADPRILRVLGLVGDRLSVSVSVDGITVRTLLRRRHTAWRSVKRLTVVPRVEMLRSHGLDRAVDRAVANVRLPVPGLKWVLRRVLRAVMQRIPQDTLVEVLGDGGNALTHIERRGFDIELDGALALVAFLSVALSDVIAAEAARHDVQVVVEEP